MSFNIQFPLKIYANVLLDWFMPNSFCFYSVGITTHFSCFYEWLGHYTCMIYRILLVAIIKIHLVNICEKSCLLRFCHIRLQSRFGSLIRVLRRVRYIQIVTWTSTNKILSTFCVWKLLHICCKKCWESQIQWHKLAPTKYSVQCLGYFIFYVKSVE